MHRRTNTTVCGIVFLAVLAIAAVAFPAAAVGDPMDVTIDDPANQTIEVDVDFSGSTTAEAKLVDGTTVLRNESLSGATGETLTADLNVSGVETGSYVLRVDATDESVASLNTTRMVYERQANFTDAQNESLQVDVSFDGAENATAHVDVAAADTGSTLTSESVSYLYGQHGDNEWVRTLNLNASDGLESGDLTVTTTVSPASTYDAVWVTTSGSGSGLLAGTIGGQDADTALLGAAGILAVLYYGRNNGWF